MPPHVYATSTDGYRGLTTRGKNQAILVTGESGAGKTETVKILMGHLAYIAGKANDKTVDKLLKANPLLESFGNAKTGRNDNSSRFGKFSQMEFDDLYGLVGSKCVTYLLEKSRVVAQTKLERNFHIMYQLLSAPDAVKNRLQLSNKKVVDFNYTSHGDVKTSVIEGKADGDHYLATMAGLELIGVGPKLRALVEESIAGILHMGQIAFHAGKATNDGASVDKKTDEAALISACKMLGVEPKDFESSVVSRVIEVEGKKLPVPLNVEQATSGRDALSKEIYSRIFNWLVLIINFETSFSCNGNDEQQSRMKGQNCSTISLLDIFGFECFAVNGFEQFCINFANEKLQQRFTQDVFMTVQKEYQSEGLPWEIIKYKDNQETLDMVEGRLGIIDLLNEECLIPKGTDANFLTKIKQSFQSHYAFSFEQRARESFSIRHYAGPVTYTVTNFMDSNKDAVPNNLETMLATSTNPLVKRLFSTDIPFFKSEPELLLAEDNDFVKNFLLLTLDSKTGVADIEMPENLKANGDARRSSVRMKAGGAPAKSGGGFVVSEKILTKFKNQLANLMEMVNITDVQYVRCIKPNSNKSSTEYDRRMVVEQLRSAGMIEAVRISRAAFPNRLLYAEFMGRFQILRPKKWHDSVLKNLTGKSPVEQLKGTTQEFLKWAIPDNKKEIVDGTGTTTHYAFGHTKVYFTSLVLEKLESARNKAVYSHVVLIQKIGRGYACRKIYARKVAAIQILGRLARTARERMMLYKMKKALRLLQSLAQMLYVRNKYRPIRDQYRKERNLKKAQEQLEIALNMQGLREKYLAERAKKAAIEEERKQKLAEEKRVAEELARQAEEDRLRAIEEKKKEEEAKLRYYQTLETTVQEHLSTIESLKAELATAQNNIQQEKENHNVTVTQLAATAITIEALKKAEVDSKSAIEREKSLYKQLQTRFEEAQSKVTSLEKSSIASKTSVDEADARTKLLESRLATATSSIIAFEASELALKSSFETEQSKSKSLEKKLQEAVDKKTALESSEKSLKLELEDLNERLVTAETRYKKAESTIGELTEHKASYEATVEAETARATSTTAKLTQALARIAALEVLENSVKLLRSENERLKESETQLEIANDTLASFKTRELSLRSQLDDAFMKIEELEKRPVGNGLGDGSSVLSGLNDMEIVIDEDQGKMKVIITKRRPDGQTALGAVERITL